jgi:ATP-dependent DNA helicase RecG
MQGSEDEYLEFKEARTQYSAEELVKYCTALANECGGSIIFGVTNKKPRQVVGTNAFADLNSIKAKLVDRLKLYVEASVVEHLDGRVVVFEVPPRPVGVPIPYKGAYLMRAGEDLVAMARIGSRVYSMKLAPTSQRWCAPEQHCLT